VGKNAIQIDLRQAKLFFGDWKQMCDADNGVLWGFSLHTPLMFIDDDRNIVANQPDKDGLLHLQEDVYVGKFPADRPYSATATSFGGTHWGTIPWQMVSTIDKAEVLRLMFHEAFHCIQPPDFFVKNVNNGHLNNLEARISILLEMSALLYALGCDGHKRMDAVKAALSARQKRVRDFGDLSDEAFREMVEGTAVYTEIRMGMPEEKHLDELAVYVNNARSTPMLSTYAGYCLGALYCFVLDKFDEDARREMGWDAKMAELLRNVAKISDIPTFEMFDYTPYGYNTIIEEEKQKAEENTRRINEIKEKFIHSSVLSIYSEGRASISGQMIAVEDLGMVMRGKVDYHGEAGNLVADGGDLLKVRQDLWRVSAQDMVAEGNKLIGNDWVMNFVEDFELSPDGEGGTNWILRKRICTNP